MLRPITNAETAKTNIVGGEKLTPVDVVEPDPVVTALPTLSGLS
jgi:hypothetical protein